MVVGWPPLLKVICPIAFPVVAQACEHVAFQAGHSSCAISKCCQLNQVEISKVPLLSFSLLGISKLT